MQTMTIARGFRRLPELGQRRLCVWDASASHHRWRRGHAARTAAHGDGVERRRVEA